MENTINFIDTENIGRRVISFLLKHAKDEQCVVFYTKNAPTIPMEDLASLVNVLHNVQFEKCVPGQNALDMQLVSQLGFHIAKNSKAKYNIVSNDHDFEPVIEYWSSRGISIERIGTTQVDDWQRENNIKVEKNPHFETAKKHKNNHIQENNLYNYKKQFIVNGINDKDADKILKIIFNYHKAGQKKRLTRIYTEMLKVFGSNNGLTYYRIVKPFISDIFTALNSPKQNQTA